MHFVTVEGSHFEMGVQHGRALKQVIRNNVKGFCSKVLELADNENSSKDLRASYETIYRNHFGYVLDEIHGIANGSDLEYEDTLFFLMVWEFLDNCVPENRRRSFLHSVKAIETVDSCSCIVAAGAATVNGKSLATQNSDWPSLPMLSPIPFAIKASPRGRFKFVGRALAGFLGAPKVIGFNEKGLTFVSSGVHQNAGGEFGVPPLFMVREALEHFSTVKEVLSFVQTIPKWSHSGENVDVVDASGSMARISVSSNRVAVATTQGDFLTSTNHYPKEIQHLGPSPDDYPSSYHRYARLTEIIKENYGKISPGLIMTLMSDHSFGKDGDAATNSICRHGGVTSINNVICSPISNELWISEGSPCKGAYSKFTL